MRIKRLLVVAGVVALMGLLWGSPVSADGHLPSITLDPASVPPETGDVTLTITGANWSEPTPFFIVACPGAAGDPVAPLTLTSAPEAIAMCPDLMAAVVPVEWDDGSFTTEWTTTITQADIDNGGLVIMAGWLSVDTLSAPEEFATVGLLAIVEPPAEEEPMEEEPMEEEPMDEAPMDDGAADEMPVTGHESGLLAIVGASVLVAGLLVIGTGRRVRTATR